MALDTHIVGLLKLCQVSEHLRECAWTALRSYRSRGLAIASGGGTKAEKHRLLHFSRERLRTDLCDLLKPMLMDELRASSTPPPATDATQQTITGE